MKSIQMFMSKDLKMFPLKLKFLRIPDESRGSVLVINYERIWIAVLKIHCLIPWRLYPLMGKVEYN
jgi:hypothetical protein